VKHYLTAVLLAAGRWGAHAQTPLESELLAAVRSAHFEDVVDFGAGNEARPVKAHLNLPARRAAHTPNVDVAFAARASFPSNDPVSPIACTQKIPALGKAIDDAVTKLSAAK
jgi:hypothetical protein